MISVVTWFWQQAGFPTRYDASHVNALFRMVRNHYAPPFRAICVTNHPDGIDQDIEVIEDLEDFAALKSPHGSNFPSCYRRLRMFKPDAENTFGDRFISLDLDFVAVGDLAPLFEDEAEFAGWQDPTWERQVNGSMLMLRAGARSEVWDRFDPQRSPAEALSHQFLGSDQAWISYVAGGQCKRWAPRDGVLSFKKHVIGKPLPEGARAVFFHGAIKPWSPEAQRLDWVRNNWNANA